MADRYIARLVDYGVVTLYNIMEYNVPKHNAACL